MRSPTRRHLLALVVATLVAACVEGRLYTAPTVVDAGVRMRLLSAYAFEDRIEVVVRLENDRREPIGVELSAWQLATPDHVLLQAKEHGSVEVFAGADLRLTFPHDRPQLTDAPGFWLQPGGLADARGPLHLAAMPIGHPTTVRPPNQN